MNGENWVIEVFVGTQGACEYVLGFGEGIWIQSAMYPSTYTKKAAKRIISDNNNLPYRMRKIL